MRIIAALQGDLVKEMNAEFDAATEGVTRGLQEAGDGLKAMLRAQVVSAGLGRRLAKTWQNKFYPNRRIDAAELVYSKAPEIARTFDTGATIHPKKGLFLAIPTKEVQRRRIGRNRMTPGDFGKLVFLSRGNGKGILVERERKTRKLRGKKNQGKVKIVYKNKLLFFLVKQTILQKRLDISRAEERISNLLPLLIKRHYEIAAGGE
jgi:hypothetical protein